MGAALSSQFQPLQNDLYRDTRRMLETLEVEDIEDTAQVQAQENGFWLQRAQAWVLLAVYEFMRKTFRRAWFSAGRAFRLTQLMKLNEIDSPDDATAVATGMGISISMSLEMGMSFPGQQQTDCVDVEEKRRTFWTVFCLDRFFCTLDGHPLTVNEDMVGQLPPVALSDTDDRSTARLPYASPCPKPSSRAARPVQRRF